MRATLPSRFALALDARAPRRSLGGTPSLGVAHHGAAPSAASSAPGATAASAAVTSSGPIGQALLEKVTAVSAKLESIMGRSDVRRSRSRPMTSRQPQSLGEKLLDLTERLSHLDDLLEDFQRQHSFAPPGRRPPSVVPAVVPAVAVAATPRSAEVAQPLVEASVKAVARSLLDAARHRSPSNPAAAGPAGPAGPGPAVGYRSPQFTPVQLVRQPSSRSTTPAAVARVRSPPASLGSTSVGLTPPPGLFVPSGFATPLTPVPQPLTPMPQFTFESLAQNASRHLNGTPRPVTVVGPPDSRSSSAAPTGRQAQGSGAETKIRQWLDTIPIGNGSERGWDDSQIRQIASFANKNHLSHLPPEQLYQRYVEHQVAEAENS